MSEAVACSHMSDRPSGRPADVHDGEAVDAALRHVAARIVKGDPASAIDRLCAGIAKDSAVFARVADELSNESPFDARFVARALATLQAIVMEDARASESRLRARNRVLLRHARHDSLTGVPNRGALDESLAVEVRRAQRYAQPLSVLFVDIDHFKHINDSLGHAAGDHVLQQVASAMGRSLRPGDVVGRYGGEEFVIGLVNAGPRAALRTAERLRRDVGRMTFEDGAGRVRVTVSVGVATMQPEDSTTIGELVARADHAMLVAKANGRNAVCSWCAHDEGRARLIRERS